MLTITLLNKIIYVIFIVLFSKMIVHSNISATVLYLYCIYGTRRNLYKYTVYSIHLSERRNWTSFTDEDLARTMHIYCTSTISQVIIK